MRLLEQFRVRSPDGCEHTVACYQDAYYRRGGHSSPSWERIAGVRRYCLNGAESIERVDDDTFMTADGVVLRRNARPH
jgi:hypothetical protein